MSLLVNYKVDIQQKHGLSSFLKQRESQSIILCQLGFVLPGGIDCPSHKETHHILFVCPRFQPEVPSMVFCGPLSCTLIGCSYSCLCLDIYLARNLHSLRLQCVSVMSSHSNSLRLQVYWQLKEFNYQQVSYYVIDAIKF